MGTSSSSSGPGGGVPFDPPWLDSVASEIGNPLGQISGETPQAEPNPQQSGPVIPQTGVAPPRRFQNARRNLGEFVGSGSRSSLKKAIGHYSRTGMGGASNVASRMRVSTTAGAGLFTFLQGVRESSEPKVREWVNQLSAKGLSANEVADEIIGRVLPSGGSIEEESCKNSMSQAMSDLLAIDPDINLVNMDNDSIWTVMELFIAHEAFNRLNLDIGQVFESAKYALREAVSRMNEMRDYLKSEISAQIRELRTDNVNPTKEEINNLLQTAIKVTFEVFEEEV